MRDRSFILFLVLIGFLTYFPGLFNGFVGDDYLQIVYNPSIRSLMHFFQFFAGSTYVSGSGTVLAGLYYRPLMMIFFAYIYHFFGLSSFPYHFLQLTFHLGNVVLLFLFLRYFFKPVSVFALCLIFLLHPINSETVLYIANLQDLLFFFFGMSSLLFIRSSRSGYINSLLIFLCFFLALLSKESGLLFLLIGLMFAKLFQPKKFFQIGFLAVISFVFYLILKYGVAKMYLAEGSIAPIYRASLGTRFINIPEILFYYLKTFLFPFSLGTDQYWIVTKISFFDFYLPVFLVSIVGVFFFFIWLYLRRKATKLQLIYYGYFLFWFLFGLLLHIQLFPLDETVADRWFYFPFVGLLGIFGLFLSRMPWHHIIWSKYLVIFFWFGCGILGLLTFFRCFNWRNDLTLYQHDIQSVRKNFIIENAYATALIGDGQFEEASSYVKASLQEFPYYANLNNMAIIAVSEHRYVQANNYFLEAMHISRNYMVYENYSSFLLHYGQISEAESFTKRAIKLFPDSIVLRSNMRIIKKKLSK